jgi:ABC-type transporter Mla subunit MlaD
MSFRENKGLWLGLAVAAVALAALIWLLLSGAPRTVLILFPDVGDLKRDNPVLWHEYAVGKVIKIEPLIDNQVGVTIRLNEDYARRITRGSSFSLQRTALFGYVGRNAIIVETPSEPGLPYDEGEHIQGISLPKPTLVEESKQLAIEYWQRIKDQVAELKAQYEKSPYRREIEDALTQLKVLADEGARQAKEGLEQFRTDHQKDIDAVVKKLEEARDWIRKKGDEAGARRLQDEIDRLKK